VVLLFTTCSLRRKDLKPGKGNAPCEINTLCMCMSMKSFERDREAQGSDRILTVHTVKDLFDKIPFRVYIYIKFVCVWKKIKNSIQHNTELKLCAPNNIVIYRSKIVQGCSKDESRADAKKSIC
jgi:hypothetical protein